MTQGTYRAKKVEADKLFDEVKGMLGGGPKCELLTRAYETDARLFGDMARKSGELALMHHLKVAKEVARFGFDVPVVGAAILHDLVEDTDYGLEEGDDDLPFVQKRQKKLDALKEDFGDEIAGIVDAVTEQPKWDDKGELLEKDLPTYIKLWQTKQDYREAFYVKFADRLHNLYDSKSMPQQKMVTKANETQRFLMPLARAIYANEPYYKLGDLCKEIINPQQYSEIKQLYKRENGRNREAIAHVEDQLRLVLQRDTGQINMRMAELRERVKTILFEQPTPFMIYDELDPLGEQEISLEATSKKQRFTMRHIFVLFLDGTEPAEMKELFMRAFREELYKYFAIVSIQTAKRTGSPDCFTLQDHSRAHNLYKLYLVTDDMYSQYRFGIPKAVKLPVVNPDPLQVKPMITVYKHDKSPTKIERGATVLDFAFLLHDKIGLYAKEAVINGNRCTNLQTMLNNGDHVTIVSDYQSGDIAGETPYATLDWFLWTTTYLAHKKLVDYFKGKEKQENA